MSLTNPKNVGESEKFSEHFREGERFFLTGIRTVEDVNTEYGKGTMVLMKVKDVAPELGIWGRYLVAQAESAGPSDLNQWYVINRRIVTGFGSKPVKVLDPYAAPGQDEDDPGF